MTDDLKILREICEKEKRIYILEETIKNPQKIKDAFILKAPPSKPIQPHVTYKELPPYDEEKYVKLAKSEGAALGKFRFDCILFGLFMAGSLVGLLFCWIPWVIALLSWPFSISNIQNKARKLYEQDCAKVNEENNTAKQKIQQYRIDVINYEKATKEYAEKSPLLKQAHVMVQNKINNVQKEVHELDIEVQSIYDSLHISQECRNFISAHILLWYIDNGISATLEEALAAYHKDRSNGKIMSEAEIAQYKTLLDYPSKHIWDIREALKPQVKQMKNKIVKEIKEELSL